ncbi:hypothetical protein FBU59_005339 [Linderina macrospora]|uniref:Uncharacterized protein n=1 Tax=Linderina macrospora TaxID=4868 RepID=A0ACC1J312_9FUNG|nr:hypothetical protein FBU59_005339 [Linderina macrospora]
MTAIPPSQTLYIRNLNDKVQKPVLKETLYSLCVSYGRILDIVALKTTKMRGQAFVVFSDIAAATTAMRHLNGRAFFGRPLNIEYALSKSDVVAQADGTYRYGEKREHMSAEQRKRLLGIGETVDGVKRRASEDADVPEAKRRAVKGDGDEKEEDQESDGEQDMNDGDSDDDSDIGPMPPPPPQTAGDNDGAADPDVGPQVEDAEETPAPTLFVSNLPHYFSAPMLSGLFQSFAGFRQVRLVEGKKGFAFVDYESAQDAAAARDVLDGFKVEPYRVMHIKFAR